MSYTHYSASDITVDDGKWTHVAVTVDQANSNVKFYLNNSNVFTLENEELNIAVNSNYPLLVGKTETGSNYFKGDIDMVNIYDTALTDTNIDTELATFPIMHATLDYPTGITDDIKDASGYHALITLSNDPETTNFGYQPGNKAMSFTSNSSQSVEVSGVPSKDIPDIDRFTISAWVNPTADTTGTTGEVPILTKEGTFTFGLNNGSPYLGLPN